MERRRNVRTKPRNADSTNKATQTINNVDVAIEIARLQEQVRLLQLENNVLRQHVLTSNKVDHDNTCMSLRAEAQEVPKITVRDITCKCKGNCSTKRCRCVKENSKCTASCKCSNECKNQESEDQNGEPDQENKENIMSGIKTPKKQKRMIQNGDAIKTKDKDLPNDKVTNDIFRYRIVGVNRERICRTSEMEKTR